MERRAAGAAVAWRSRGGVGVPRLHHGVRLPQQPAGAGAVLPLQEPADARQHDAAQHQRQRHAGVRVRHHPQLRLQPAAPLAVRPPRLHVVRLRQLVLR